MSSGAAVLLAEPRRLRSETHGPELLWNRPCLCTQDVRLTPPAPRAQPRELFLLQADPQLETPLFNPEPFQGPILVRKFLQNNGKCGQEP